MGDKIQSYKDLVVWRKSMDLVKQVYASSNRFPEDEKFGLSSQMRRSAVSVPSNIAEGWGRSSDKDFTRFLKIAKGSLFELETQIILAQELRFMSENQSIYSLIAEVGKMLNALVKFINERLKIGVEV